MIKEKLKVLVSTSSFGKADPEPLQHLSSKCHVKLNPYGRRLTSEEFVKLADGIDGVIAGVEIIDRKALMHTPMIKVISRCGVGIDNIDVDACEDLGIKLFNTPNAPVDSVAEHTIALILDLIKNVSIMNNLMKNGNWGKRPGFMLCRKKIGIIGMGRIGKRVAELLSGFGVEICYTDLEKKDIEYKYMSKRDLLKWADIVTIHTSSTDDTNYVIGKDDIEGMKATAFLVNTSRGRFVDEESLYNALKDKRLQGAALDVFDEEPYKGKLIQLDNTVLTPHISSSAKEARAVMEMEAVQNLFKGLGIE